ncbi:MAG: efflux transporter outer membrane subunit [Candidatus Omnitrophica bacterium]|nr:efflux transporter outer membrane subunit [Candidatus Omnitrophota bacterium]
MGLPEISIRRPILATMMSLTLVLFGAIGIRQLPVRELPDVDPPIVNVTSVYPGASAQIVETQVTEPLEEAITTIEGIKTLTSQSREQASLITIEFDLSRDVELAAQDVRDRISRVRGKLPDDLDEPVVAKQDADAQPSMWVALNSDRYSTLELTKLAEDLFKDPIQVVPGVSSVIIGGAKRFAIRIWLDSKKMAAHGVTVQDLEQALREQSVERPSGLLEGRQRELSIEMRGELKTPEEYNRLVLKQQGSVFVRLMDVGKAEVGVEDERSVARYNSHPAVGLGIVKQSKANLIEVTKGVKAELKRLAPLVPDGVNVAIAYDESVFVEKAIKEVWVTLGIAFILVILSIYVFLQNLRAVLIPAVTIPVSIISAFAALNLMGYSINIVTMLALILAIGLVVDDTIVVLENVYRHVEEGMTPMEAAFSGMKEITFAVIATTTALVAVFLPLAFQTSLTGRLFIEFAVAISFSVVISTFVALTLASTMAARVLRPVPKVREHKILDYFEDRFSALTRVYTRQLGWSMRHPYVIGFIAAAAVAASVFMFMRLEREFLPDEDKGWLFCMVLSPEGATSEYTDRMVKRMETIIGETPEVEGYFSAVAIAMGGPGQSKQGVAFIRLKEKHERHVRNLVGDPNGLQGRFFNEVQGAIAIPIVPKSIGRAFGQPFQLVLQNQDLKELNRYADELANKLRGMGFLINVRSTFEINKPELRLEIDRDRANALGVSVEDISRTLQILFGGSDLANLTVSGKEYDVIAQLQRESRLTPQDLDQLYVRSNLGDLVQLSNIVTSDTGAGPSGINHYNRLRSATIEATPVGVPLGRAMDQAKALLEKDLPPGFRYEWSGESGNLEDTGSDILIVFILAIIIIYMVLAAQFESLSHPLVVMLTLPLAGFGAFGSLWLLNWISQMGQGLYFAANFSPDPSALVKTLSGFVPVMSGMNINLYSQIGMVLLVGLVSKNAILLVDFANQRVARGMDAREAMMEAGRVRLRPIMMTAVSTIVGILPIAIGFGAGGESRRPLGVVAVGGMATSTFLTLFIIPVFYVAISRISRRVRPPKAAAGFMALLLVTSSLMSCATVGPRYETPAMELPQEWKTRLESGEWKEASPQDEADKGAWWEIFGDPELNRLEELALQENLTLEQALARVEQARALARVQKSELFPDLRFNPAAMRSRRTLSSFGSGFGGAGGGFTQNFYSTPLDLSYEIDLWGRVRNSFEARRAELDISVAEYRSLHLTLSADVAQNYFLIRELDAESAILKETVELRREALELVKNRVDAGVAGELDLSRASTELAAVETEAFDLHRRRAEIENALAVLCGKAASSFNLETGTLNTELPSIPPGLPSALLERRPDVAQAERRMAAANAEVGVAVGAFFPAIALTGSAGFESAKTSNLFETDSRVWSLGPSLSLPVFQGGRNRAGLDAAKARYEESVAAYRQQVLTAIAEVENALVALRLLSDQAQAQDKVLSSARRTAEISESRYQEGLVGYLEVVDAERSRLDAELSSARILRQRLISTVLLIKSLGGAPQSSE